MITKNFKVAALAGILGLAAVPAVSQAAVTASSSPVRETYNTSITPIFGFDFPVTGQLQLHVYPDGIIQGFYRPDYDAAFVPVTGGEQNGNVWIDIGTMGRIQVQGKLKGRTIVGTAFDQRTMREFNFNADLTA